MLRQTFERLYEKIYGKIYKFIHTRNGKMKDCRICYESDFPQNLISPCKCSGSIEYVHQRCLQEWIENAYLLQFKKNCNMCNCKYNIKDISKKDILSNKMKAFEKKVTESYTIFLENQALIFILSNILFMFDYFSNCYYIYRIITQIADLTLIKIYYFTASSLYMLYMYLLSQSQLTETNKFICYEQIINHLGVAVIVIVGHPIIGIIYCIFIKSWVITDYYNQTKIDIYSNPYNYIIENYSENKSENSNRNRKFK